MKTDGYFRRLPYGPVYVTVINGIWNNVVEAHDGIEYFSNMTPGCSVGGVYNATHGLWDLVESFINFHGINTRPVGLLHKEWDEYFNNCPDDGIIIHYCHSQGVILTRNALKNYNPELRKRIHVIAVAPAAYVDKELCGSVVHFVSNCDIVPWIDIAGRWRNRETTVVLNRHPEASYFLDHSRNSLTYEENIRRRITFIRKNFGDQR